MTDRLAKRFVDLVRKHRGPDGAALSAVSSARIYLAEEALALKLVDRIGYMQDAVAQARERAGLPEDAKLVVYRRTEYPDDNVYNPTTSYEGGRPVALFDTGLAQLLPALPSGFYYLWHPAGD
jgi:protease-4